MQSAQIHLIWCFDITPRCHLTLTRLQSRSPAQVALGGLAHSAHPTSWLDNDQSHIHSDLIVLLKFFKHIRQRRQEAEPDDTRELAQALLCLAQHEAQRNLQRIFLSDFCWQCLMSRPGSSHHLKSSSEGLWHWQVHHKNGQPCLSSLPGHVKAIGRLTGSYELSLLSSPCRWVMARGWVRTIFRSK